LTSDINNTAIPLSTKEAFEKVYMPSLITLTSKLKDLSVEWKDFYAVHMDNQPSYRLGKEIGVFCRTFRRANAFVV
jgi:adenylosuccinate lyase